MTTSALARGIFAAAIFGAVALGATPVQAQQDSGWLWGGGTQTPGGSGREVVRFNPQFGPGQLIVSFGDRRLYLVTRPGEALSYPIAIPREQSRWQGTTSVSMKRENPSWTPTAHMIAENPRLPRWVPGGHPLNPLGVRALYLGSSAYRIHGTDAPWTIGSAVSKGCIRMYNQDVIDLYPRVPVGAKVSVTWQTFGGAVAAVAAQSSADQSAQRRAAAPNANERQAIERQAVERQAYESSSREARRPYNRAPYADYASNSPRRRAAAMQAAEEAAAEQSASAGEEPAPRRRYAAAKKITAKKVTPRVSSADSSQE